MSAIFIQPVEYQSLKQIEDVDPLKDEDHELMNKIRDILVEHGAEDRFGLCLLHRHFDIEDDEYAIEESFERSRESVTKIVKLDKAPAIDDPEYVPTTWKFSSGEIENVTKCVNRCQQAGAWSHNIVHRREGH